MSGVANPTAITTFASEAFVAPPTCSGSDRGGAKRATASSVCAKLTMRGSGLPKSLSDPGEPIVSAL